MLKGNLIVGKTQSVVVRAESLPDLIKLAESKSHGSNSDCPLSLRVDLTDDQMVVDVAGGHNRSIEHRSMKHRSIKNQSIQNRSIPEPPNQK